MHDVAVIGGGPGGMALARSLTDRSLDVVVISPSHPWHATYGAWRDDVASCEFGAPLDSLLRGAWPTVRVVGNREHLVPRGYVVFDNIKLSNALGSGVTRIDATVDGVEHSVDASMVRLHDARTVQACLVIDATGSGSFLAQRSSTVGAQTAYGVVVSGSHPAVVRANVRADVFTLMDWSRPPTFLYAAQFNDGRVLLEETSLYSRPAHAIDDLHGLLAARLGVDATSDADTIERVEIPMGTRLPLTHTRVVGFGAAAGYIHPVTGYSVAASLRAAPRVAEAIHLSLSRHRRGADLSTAAWQAVWPDHLVRTRHWHDMGLSVLSGLPRHAIPGFFDAFFDLPQELSTAYLRIDSDPGDVRRAMLGVFRRVNSATKLRLMSSPGGLLRALAAR